jgi:hypothetical protein
MRWCRRLPVVAVLLSGIIWIGDGSTIVVATAEAGQFSACAACHGTDGRGTPQSTVGFDTPIPDFTDCSFATPEPDADWLAVMHDGGPLETVTTLVVDNRHARRRAGRGSSLSSRSP